MDEKSKKIKLLPLEALKKALDERGIEYDDMEIKRPYFPLEDVEACLYDTTPSFIRHLSATYIKDNANRRACPLCGKPSEELKWISFISSKRSWQNLSGRGGPMSICPDCGCLVEFIRIIMN
jgi:hypothetical protein